MKIAICLLSFCCVYSTFVLMLAIFPRKLSMLLLTIWLAVQHTTEQLLWKKQWGELCSIIMFNLVYFQTIAYCSYKDQTEMSKIWVIDQAYSFEKAGYQPSSFLHVFGQSVQKRIKNEAIISSYPDHTSLVNKGFIF